MPSEQVSPQEPLPTPSAIQEQATAASYNKTIHNLSLACIVICPLLIALPPRKFDLYTASLGTATILSANRLHRDAYGQSIGARLSPVASSPGEAANKITADLPTERAQAVAAELKRRREEGMSDAQRAKAARDRDEAGRGVLDRVWYGEERGADWQERRDAEDRRKVLEEGKSIGDIIMDQIWEVWSWGKSEGRPGDGDDNSKAG